MFAAFRNSVLAVCAFVAIVALLGGMVLAYIALRREFDRDEME